MGLRCGKTRGIPRLFLDSGGSRGVCLRHRHSLGKRKEKTSPDITFRGTDNPRSEGIFRQCAAVWKRDPGTRAHGSRSLRFRHQHSDRRHIPRTQPRPGDCHTSRIFRSRRCSFETGETPLCISWRDRGDDGTHGNGPVGHRLPGPGQSFQDPEETETSFFTGRPDRRRCRDLQGNLSPNPVGRPRSSDGGQQENSRSLRTDRKSGTRSRKVKRRRRLRPTKKPPRTGW